jgi:ADP-heptose:LPS heptosyltransferase
MTSIASKIGQPQRIVIFRALVLGDLLCTTPALRAIRHTCPDAEITLVGLPWAKNFVSRYPHLIDQFMEFPGYPGLPEIQPDLKKIPEFFKAAQSKNFDLAIQMHGSGAYVNSITVLMGARRNAGFYVKGDYCPDPKMFMQFPSEEHEIIKYIRLTEFLGAPTQGLHLEFPLTAQDVQEYLSIPGVEQLTGDYVCIHPGSRLLSRRWLPERFAQVAEKIASWGMKVVLTGSNEEKELTDFVSRMIKAPHMNLAGKTSLGALGVLLKNSRMLISNDTGLSHVASALQVPSVIVISGSDFNRWVPLNRKLHKFVYADVDCRPCMYEVCPIGQLCARAVSVDDVLSSVRELVRGENTYESSNHQRTRVASGAFREC